MISIDAHFEDIAFYIQKELEQAKESVKICVAWINWKMYSPIFDQLTSRKINVEIMYNDDFRNHKFFYPPAYPAALYPIKNRGRFLMHNKFCIIDNSTIITGSFNWSINAGRHFENLVIIRNDFKTIKKFLIEFQDLKNYFIDFPLQKKIQCLDGVDEYEQCTSSSYNLGVLGSESGKYEESLIETWNICLLKQHATFLGESYENHLYAHLGLEDNSYNDYDAVYEKDTMLAEVNQQFQQIENIRNHFVSRSGQPIHAIGTVEILNETEHIERNELKIFGINIFWRDMYYRKTIPKIIYDDHYGPINSIINKHFY